MSSKCTHTYQRPPTFRYPTEHDVAVPFLFRPGMGPAVASSVRPPTTLCQRLASASLAPPGSPPEPIAAHLLGIIGTPLQPRRRSPLLRLRPVCRTSHHTVILPSLNAYVVRIHDTRVQVGSLSPPTSSSPSRRRRRRDEPRTLRDELQSHPRDDALV
ncbi:hypothetical protein LY76DRAFT_186467 [Colletotrichum caudatum]|nr:hypothetical protein LY76DRAFT_186467 [Colletotrichum caudatum]